MLPLYPMLSATVAAAITSTNTTHTQAVALTSWVQILHQEEWNWCCVPSQTCSAWRTDETGSRRWRLTSYRSYTPSPWQQYHHDNNTAMTTALPWQPCCHDNSITMTTYDKTWPTSMDRAMHCITPSHHRAVHKAGRWVWSTGDGCRLTVDNTWQWQTHHHKRILNLEVGEKLHRELRLFLEIFEFCICLINILQLQGSFSPKPEALDPVEAKPWTLCIGLCMQWLSRPTTLM